MFNRSTGILVLFYGLLLIGMGILGYQNAHSKVSLIMGVGFGVLVMGSSLLLFAKKNLGIIASLTLTILLSVMFAVRFFLTHKQVPGMLALVSSIMLIYLLVQLVQTAPWKKSR